MRSKLSVFPLIACALMSYLKIKSFLKQGFFQPVFLSLRHLVLFHFSSRASPWPDSLIYADTATTQPTGNVRHEWIFTPHRVLLLSDYDYDYS